MLLRRSSAEVALLVTVAIWSLNFSAVKAGVTAMEPLVFAVVRFSLGAATTVALVRWREGPLRFARADLPALLVAAFFGITLNQLCFVLGLAVTSASNTALLVGTIPIWTALVAVGLRHERLSTHHWLGLAGGLAGVALVVAGTQAPAVAPGAVSLPLLGELLALGTAASWGVYSVLIRPLMARYSAMRLSSFMMTAGTLALVPLAVPGLLRFDPAAVPAEAWLALLYATFLSVTLTNILYFTAIARVGASRAALYTYLEPFLGVLFAVALLSERVSLLQLTGGVVIVAAIAFARPRQVSIAEPGM
ncbi:MAG TPA: DMT family transporter [Candidatus Limnocylindrales bacterium]|nr:DMT family transporter [Candidatus Limnocylindrales bacterium]